MSLFKKLDKGDTIGIIALSSAAPSRELINIGVSKLESLGFKVDVAPNCFSNYHNYCGTDQERISYLESYFSNPKIKALIALRGGYGSIRILSQINYDIIKNNPKIFVGFSDLTSFQTAMYVKTGLPSFQGPMLTTNFANSPSQTTLDSFFNMLANPDHLTITNQFNVINEGTTEGILIGGNLITFMTLVGTNYMVDFSDKILYFEDINEYTYSIDRALSHLMLLSGIEKIKGIVFGSFTDCKTRNTSESTLIEIFTEKTKHLDIPIVYGVQAGHSFPTLTIPIGAQVVLNTQQKILNLTKRIIK
ncbi:MAG: S66 peptidase family protein [Brevinemataceae bacterium]